MPSTNQHGGSPPYPDMPEVVEEHGENPARFVHGSKHLVIARIKGIDDRDLLLHYLRAERDREGGPRGEVTTLIHRKIEEAG